MSGIPNYPNNSRCQNGEDRKKPEEKNLRPLQFTGNVGLKKKGVVHKIFSALISDEFDDPGNYILNKVFLPRVKRAIADAVDILLNGEIGRSNKNNRNYISEYRGGYRDDRDSVVSVRNNSYDTPDFFSENYGDCEAVLDELNHLIERYGMVSISDLHDIIGQPNPGNHTDCKYGWTSLRTAKIVPVRGGFVLKLPRVIPLG